MQIISKEIRQANASGSDDDDFSDEDAEKDGDVSQDGEQGDREQTHQVHI